MISLVLASLLSLSLSFSVDPTLSCSSYHKAYLAIDRFFTKHDEAIPSSVRLAFHDCLGRKCDGCLNFKDKSNTGLKETAEKLEVVYSSQGIDKLMSRADFWQLAAQIGFVRGGFNRKCASEECDFFSMQFKWGRTECENSPWTNEDEDAGDAHGDFSELRRILNGNFDLDDKEIVTIMGAHSLGGAHQSASGFEYNWQKRQTTFDNSYYFNMANLKYGHKNVAEGKNRKEFVWEGNGGPELQMLNVDMALYKEIDAVKGERKKFTGDLTCKEMKRDVEPFAKAGSVRHCPNADSAQQVIHYAKNLGHFYDDFPHVWKKISDHGWRGLRIPGVRGESCGFCVPIGGYCVPRFKKAGKCCPGSTCVKDICVEVYDGPN